MEIKNWPPIDSIWNCLDWEFAVITNTLCSTANGESLKVLYTPS